jgi:hypothetical protein
MRTRRRFTADAASSPGRSFRSPNRPCRLRCKLGVGAVAQEKDGARIEGPCGVSACCRIIALLVLDRVELGAQDCLGDHAACAFKPAALRSSYAVRAGLPLPAGWPGGEADPVKMRDADTVFHLRDAARGRCEIGSLALGCVFSAETARPASQAQQPLLN